MGRDMVLHILLPSYQSGWSNLSVCLDKQKQEHGPALLLPGLVTPKVETHCPPFFRVFRFRRGAPHVYGAVL